MWWQLYERKRGLRVRIEVFLQRVRAEVNIAFIDVGHFVRRRYLLRLPISVIEQIYRRKEKRNGNFPRAGL